MLQNVQSFSSLSICAFNKPPVQFWVLGGKTNTSAPPSILEFSVHLLSMSVAWGKKLEKLEKTLADTGRTDDFNAVSKKC